MSETTLNKKANETLITANFDKYGSSPAMLQRDALTAIKRMLNNEYGIIDPANPVALLLETSAMQTAGAVGKYWTLNRRQYPIAAQTHEDLWYHLSEQDWIGVFALPSKANFIIVFHYDEVVNMVKPLENGNKLLRIPRGMRITVGGVDFLLDYPVNITQLKHGGFRVTYDTKEKSPIQELSTNIVEHSIATIGSNGEDSIKRFSITVEMIQVTETVLEDAVTANMPVNLSKTFPDEYFYSRVYTGHDDTGWKELSTTHVPDVYDPYKPTATLKMIENNDDNTLTVTIPKLYNGTVKDMNTGMISSTIGPRVRVEIYSTLGNITMNLDEYIPSQFTFDWFPAGERKRDYSGLDKYSAPLKSVQSVAIYSNSFISQGRDKLTFEELRKRVIDNTTGPNVVPVSHNQIEDKNQDHNFKIIKSVDYITSRCYWAVRDIPIPSNPALITPASASIETITTTINELVSTGSVIDNDKRITILPDTIYQLVNGKIMILNDEEVKRIKELNPENRAKRVNQHEMFYSPFHYVVDLADESIRIRPYYLDTPRAISKSFIDANNTTDIALTIGSYSIEKTDRGYVIYTVMRSNDDYKKLADDEIWAQLLVHPHGDKGYAYIKGEFVGRTDEKEPIFKFPLNTKFDVDRTHSLVINNTSLPGTNEVNIPIDLETDIELIYGFYGKMDGWSRSRIDNKFSLNLVNHDAKALVNENIKVRFGYHLEYLWTRARTHASEITYARHLSNVPLTYTEDVYEKDPVTGNIMNIVEGKPVYNIVHHKGDIVLDKGGHPVYRFKQGDIVLNEAGKPVVREPRKIIRRLELMLVDATYWFATDEISEDYRQELVLTILDWLVDDLKPLNRNTLEQTKILFYPSSTMGELRVMYNEGVPTFINAAQSLILDLTVNKQVFLDYDIQAKIKESSIKIIKEEFKKETVSSSSIISKLVKEHGNDVIGIKLRNLGNSDRIISFTTLEEGKQPTIRKKLTVNSDESLSVDEDITFNFILHDYETI